MSSGFALQRPPGRKMDVLGLRSGLRKVMDVLALDSLAFLAGYRRRPCMHLSTAIASRIPGQMSN